MSSVINIETYQKDSILTSLKKLKDLLKNGPDFNDKNVSDSWCESLTKQDKNKVKIAFEKFSKRTFFPKNPDEFVAVFEESERELRQAHFKIERSEAEKQAEIIFEMVMSHSFIGSLSQAREKYQINKIGFFWVETNFKNVDELKLHFDNVNFRKRNKELMLSELVNLHERYATDSEFKSKIDAINRPKTEEDIKKQKQDQAEKIAIRIAETHDSRLKKVFERIKHYTNYYVGCDFAYDFSPKNAVIYVKVLDQKEKSMLKHLETINFEVQKNENAFAQNAQ